MGNPVEVIGSISTAHYRTEITTAGHVLVSDEGEALGGKDLGPTPSAFLGAALASCTAITLRMYADRKEWDLKKADIHVTVERDREQNITKITRVINLTGDLSESEKERLLAIANRCPVHLMLSHPIEITSTLAP